MITNIPFPVSNTQCYALGATVYGNSDGNGKIVFPRVAFQSIASDGFLLFTRVRFESNIPEDAFAGSLVIDQFANSFNIGIQYGTGGLNTVFKQNLLVHRFLDVEVNQFTELQGNNPTIWLMPNVRLVETSTLLGGMGQPAIHAVVTVLQCNNESFLETQRKGIF
jgi:hypothetical protein